MNSLFLYNTEKQKKEKFNPINKNEVKIYSCGPTVYNFCHIGNLRAFIFTDLLRRTLKLLKYNVNHTMNITDVDDKIIKASLEQNLSIKKFTKPWTDAFFEDLDKIFIERVEHYPKATDSIDEMNEILKKLQENNLIYEKEDGIYYNIEKFSEYGSLTQLDKSNLKSGLRYDTDEYEKNDIRDFAVWKKEANENYSWESDFGRGRPGWHLECSAMIRKIYKSSIDIHTGGIDLVFPHHENEIAQSKGAYPKENFVNYWLHCEHLLVENQKMSKSKDNFYTLRDLIKRGYCTKSIRFMMLNCHYRTKLNFSEKQLEDSFKLVQKIQNCLDFILEKVEDYNFEITQKPKNYSKQSFETFLSFLSDDLNTPRAFASIFEEVKRINFDISKNSLKQEDYKDIYIYFNQINRILAVLNFSKNQKDDIIQKMIDKRNLAKKQKNFTLADNIRDELKKQGIIIEDTKDGTRWKKI